MKIKVKLFYHLKARAGTSEVNLEMPSNATIRDIKNNLETQFPQLRAQLDNVMILMDKKIVLETDQAKDNAEISFLTPVGGG